MKQFILYDGRAKFGDTDDASIMDTAESEKEARKAGNSLWKGYDALWCEYECLDGKTLINEVKRYDIPPSTL